MSFLRKLFSFGGCDRLSGNKENVKNLFNNDTEDIDDAKNGLLVCPEVSLSDQLSDLNYIPGAWRSPSMGMRIVDRVRDSPRLARKAMSKMTSPLVSRKKKEDEIYIVTLHVVHGVGWRGEGRSDAW